MADWAQQHIPVPRRHMTRDGDDTTSLPTSQRLLSPLSESHIFHPVPGSRRRRPTTHLPQIISINSKLCMGATQAQSAARSMRNWTIGWLSRRGQGMEDGHCFTAAP